MQVTEVRLLEYSTHLMKLHRQVLTIDARDLWPWWWRGLHSTTLSSKLLDLGTQNSEQSVGRCTTSHWMRAVLASNKDPQNAPGATEHLMENAD